MEEPQRELATNRLLEIIRGERVEDKQASAEEKKVGRLPSNGIDNAVDELLERKPHTTLREVSESKEKTPPLLSPDKPLFTLEDLKERKGKARPGIAKRAEISSQPVSSTVVEAQDYELPDNLLPFSQRMAKKLKNLFGKKTTVVDTTTEEKASADKIAPKEWVKDKASTKKEPKLKPPEKPMFTLPEKVEQPIPAEKKESKPFMSTKELSDLLPSVTQAKSGQGDKSVAPLILEDMEEADEERTSMKQALTLKKLLSKKDKSDTEAKDENTTKDEVVDEVLTEVTKSEEPTDSKAKKTGFSLANFRNKGKRILVLDVGTSSIKLLEVIKKSEGYSLVDWESRSIPTTVRKTANGLRLYTQKMLREMLTPKRVKGADVYLSLSDRASQVRTVELPEVTEKEKNNAVKFQIKKDLPFPIESTLVTDRGWDSKTKGRQEVEVLAVDQRQLEEKLDMLDELGILPKHITSVPTTTRFLMQDYKGVKSEESAVAVADIGAAKTTITILESDKVVLSRTISTGGDDFTNVLQGLGLGPDGADLTEEQAEDYKMKNGLPPEGDPATMRIAILMRPVAERISAEITRSLDFYRRNRGGREFQKLILVGGSARMKRLPEFLSENLGVTVEVGDPLKRIAPFDELEPEKADELRGIGPVLMPALAVALDHERLQNVLPPEQQRAVKLNEAKRVIAPTILTVFAFMVYMHVVAMGELKDAKVDYGALKGKLESLNEKRAQYLVAKAKFDKLSADMTERQSDFDAIKVPEQELHLYMKAISNLVPSFIYLESMETKFIPEVDQIIIEREALREESAEQLLSVSAIMQKVKSASQVTINEDGSPGKITESKWIKRPVFGRVVELNGLIYSQGSLTDVQFVDFVFGLENSGWFRDVAVEKADALENGKIAFKIICGI